jgi:TNF receptor-associated protein 1
LFVSIQVLFLYNSIDDFVMSNLKNYSGRTLKSAEDASIDLSSEDTEEQKTQRAEKKQKEEEEAGEGEGGKKAGGGAIPEAELEPFCAWLKETLGESRVREIKVTTRLSDSPAIITDHESGAVRRMMKMVVRAPLCLLFLSLLFSSLLLSSPLFSSALHPTSS